MATYYRWRKSTVTSALELEKTCTAGQWIVKGVDSSRVYYSATYEINENEVGLTGTIDYETINPNSGTRNIYLDYWYIWGSTASDRIFTPRNSWASVSHYSNGEQLVVGEGTVDVYQIKNMPGTSQGYVYSTSSSAYPNGGVKDGYYYDQRTTVTSPTAPSNLTYPNPITTQKVTVSWDAATSNVPGVPVSYYTLMYSINGGPFTAIGNNGQTTTGTSYEFTIPLGTDTIQFRLAAIDSQQAISKFTDGETVPVYFSPTLTVPSQLMQGQQATVNWTSIEGAESYTLQRKSSADADWTQVYSGANLTFSETVGTWTTVQYRVQAVFDGTAGGWTESAVIPVVSASSLVISGTDEDLGVVTNDIPYSISTDTGNQITATITVNNAVIFSGNVGNSTADVIPILDLITGEGTIVISATVDASGSPVTATRTWTYEKAAITFPNSGSVAQVTKEGENIYPKVLAEGVRLPGGKTLDQVMGFPCQIYAGSYVGTGTSGASNPNTLTFPFEPKILFISTIAQGSMQNCGWIYGCQYGLITTRGTGSPTNYQIDLTWGENSITWYATQSADPAAVQLNSGGITYKFVAIG